MSINQLNTICAEAPDDLNLSWGIGAKPRDDEFYVVHQGWEERSRFTDYIAEVIAKLGYGYKVNRPDHTRDTIEITLRNRQTLEALDRYICEHFGVAAEKRPLGIMTLDRDSRIASVDAEGVIEAAGGSYAFADEYDACINCGGIIHVGSESYGDIGRFNFVEGEGYECLSCMEKDPGRYAQEYAEGAKNERTIAYYLDPTADDFVALDGKYENGLHPGMNDDPVAQREVLMRAMKTEYAIRITEARYALDQATSNDEVPYAIVERNRAALRALESPTVEIKVLTTPRFALGKSQFYVEWTIYVWRGLADVAAAALGAKVAA